MMESGEGHKKRKDVGRQEEGVVTASELELCALMKWWDVDL